jgi:hypothetical protein
MLAVEVALLSELAASLSLATTVMVRTTLVVGFADVLL